MAPIPMPHRTLSGALCALALVAGCKGREPAATTPGRSARAAPAGRTASPPRLAPAPAPAAIPEAQVRATFQAWLDAQNRADLEAYGRLYATRFQGVKRSGPRTRSFDRAGWLRDRARMFQAAMRVEARDVVVESSAQAATVRFTQAFATAGYEDAGPKQLVLMREGADLRITREEMLRSDLADAGAGAAAAAPLAPGSFMLVVQHGGPWLVLDAAPQESWATGAPALVTRGDVVVTRKAVDPQAAPAALTALRGREVRVYGEAGQACTGRVGELAVLHRVDVHFGTTQTWDGEEGSPRVPDDGVAQQAWGMGAGGYVLAARLEPATRGCDGARWARAADLPPAPVFVRTSAPAPLATAALARFRALPAHRALQASYAQDPGATAGRPWDAHDGNVARTWLWRDAPSGRQFVTVWATVALGGCGEFSGGLWAVFEARGGNLVLLSDPEDPGAHEPLAATDADGDGAADFVVNEGLVRRQGTVHRLVESLAFPNLDCGC